MSAPARKARAGDELEVDLERLDERGQARGTSVHGGERYDVRLRLGVPESRVRARVRRRRGARVEADVVDTLAASPHATAPRCAHFGPCGGCSFQHVAYARELVEKRGFVERALRSAGLLAGADAPRVEPCRGSEPPWRYRNKMDFTFGARRWVAADEPMGVERSFALGLHPAHQFRKVLDVVSCAIAFEEADSILASVRRAALALALAPWDVVQHTGLLRHLVLRKGLATGEILADLVTSEPAHDEVEPLVRAVLAAHREITTFVQRVNDRPASIAVGDRERVWHGPGTIRERLAGFEFELSAESFFQVNTRQAELLVAEVVREAACGRDDRVLDLYCGAGTLALPLARHAREVAGVEIAPHAVEDARRNARRNGVANVRFVAGDVATEIDRLAQPRAAVCVVDPPRAGLHAAVVAGIARLAPPRVVYVSCNPAAAARDCAALASRGWRLVRAQPIDLFPHTPHVECVLTLVRSA